MSPVYDRLGRALGRRLFEQTRRRGARRPGLTLGAIVSIGIALSVLLLTVLSVIFATRLILGGGGPFWMVVGLILLAMAWVVRPRFPDAGPGQPITLADAPATLALVGSIAAAVGSPRPGLVVATGEWNASVHRAGLRRVRVLRIGAPLMVVLGPQERVAILAHEMAHDVSGDPTRGFIVSTALTTLLHWRDVLEPGELLPSEAGILGFLGLPVTMTLRLLSKAAFWLAAALALFTYRSSQRAEYRADELAAGVAGRDATLAALDALHYFGAYRRTVTRLALATERRDFIDELRWQVANTPERELERLRRGERASGSRLDDSHPPTAYRVDVLVDRPPTQPQVVLGAGDSARMDLELAQAARADLERIVGVASDRLYD